MIQMCDVVACVETVEVVYVTGKNEQHFVKERKNAQA